MITKKLTPGTKVDVDRKAGHPELSPKKFRHLAARDLIRPPANPENCKVFKATEFYAMVETPSGRGLLTNRGEPWSRYEVPSGLLTEGQSLALVSTSKRDDSGRRKMRFPIFPVAMRATTLLHGKIAFWRPNAMRKKDEWLRNIIYVHTGNGYLVRAECNDLLDITEHFDIGEKVQVRLSNKPPLRDIPFGTLEPGNTNQRQLTHELCVGEQVTGKVVRLLPGGAFVLIAYHCRVYLPANTVMPDKRFIGNAIQCGDVVEGVVTEVSKGEPRRRPRGQRTDDKANASKGVISFSRLVEPSAVSRQYRDPLIDVTAERKVAVQGVLSEMQPSACQHSKQMRIPVVSAVEIFPSVERPQWRRLISFHEGSAVPILLPMGYAFVRSTTGRSTGECGPWTSQW